MPFNVPIAPPAPNAGWISSLSLLLMVSGVVLVLCALPPIRKAAGNLVDEIDSALRPKPKKKKTVAVAVETATAQDQDNGTAQTRSSGRREIDDFDLSVFDS